mmetsp:Transcript_30871/g.80036  ORF Transcript_30871/g.80036 Transcript_30871/m.80036 type:complete len:254 (-) Transcript_30871:1398-2159(-)
MRPPLPVFAGNIDCVPLLPRGSVRGGSVHQSLLDSGALLRSLHGHLSRGLHDLMELLLQHAYGVALEFELVRQRITLPLPHGFLPQALLPVNVVLGHRLLRPWSVGSDDLVNFKGSRAVTVEDSKKPRRKGAHISAADETFFPLLGIQNSRAIRVEYVKSISHAPIGLGKPTCEKTNFRMVHRLRWHSIPRYFLRLLQLLLELLHLLLFCLQGFLCLFHHLSLCSRRPLRLGRLWCRCRSGSLLFRCRRSCRS